MKIQRYQLPAPPVVSEDEQDNEETAQEIVLDLTGVLWNPTPCTYSDTGIVVWTLTGGAEFPRLGTDTLFIRDDYPKLYDKIIQQPASLLIGTPGTGKVSVFIIRLL